MFKIGQYVFYHPINLFKAEGRYVVIAVYRQPDGEVRYVIRSQDDPSMSTLPKHKNFAQPHAPGFEAARRFSLMWQSGWQARPSVAQEGSSAVWWWQAKL
jgi:hypothetical protein